MSVVGLCLILAAGGGVVYFGYTLYQEIRKKIKDRKSRSVDKK